MPEKRILKGVQVQFQGPDFVRLETYRKSQPIIPTMAATVRGLVLLGLQAADGAGTGVNARFEQAAFHQGEHHNRVK
jgi:hypothetical protein